MILGVNDSGINEWANLNGTDLANNNGTIYSIPIGYKFVEKPRI